MKRWLSLILAVAVIAAICVFLVIRRNTSQQPQEPTEKETEQTEAEKREDWTFRGLQIDLTADYQQTQLEADRLCCSNGIYWVEIICR